MEQSASHAAITAQHGSRNPFLNPELTGRSFAPNALSHNGPELASPWTGSGLQGAHDGPGEHLAATNQGSPSQVASSTIQPGTPAASRVSDEESISQAMSAAQITDRMPQTPAQPDQRLDPAEGSSGQHTPEQRPSFPPPPMHPSRRHSQQALFSHSIAPSPQNSPRSRQNALSSPSHDRSRLSGSLASAQTYSTSPPSTIRDRSGSLRVPFVSGTDYPEPTSVPTPGRPLLREGKLLVMPPTWESCSKCQGTGFKHADPSQPHDACWRSYGRSYNAALVTSADIVDRAMILQKPLPSWARPAGAPPGSLGMPGSWNGNQSPLASASYAPPSHAPPSRTSASRPQPPRTNRAQEASEAAMDAEGEAPPAYDDVIRVPQGVALPPQRQEGSNGNGTTGVSSSGSQTFQPPSEPPPHPPRPGHPQQNSSYGYNGHNGHNGWHQGQPPGQYGYTGQGSPYGMHQSHHQYPHHHPQQQQYQQHQQHQQGPVVVPPGDPRIGGTLCYKCGGSGTRASLWSSFVGEEDTCSACAGLGRIRR